MGKKALDSIAPRVARTLVNYGVKPPNGSTEGATVMAWTVLDRFSEYSLTAAAPGNAFEFIRERLLELATQSTSEAVGAKRVRTEQPEATVDPAATGRGEDRNVLIESLEDSARLAILAFDEAAQALSVTADHITDRMAWEWIGENSDDYDRPAFETFSRYLRNARKALGEHKNNPRAGRRGRSVIDESGL